jgi:hypothetical protein
MSNQHNESSFAGKSRITVDPNAGGNVVFEDAAGAQVKNLYLDPQSAHAIELSTACQCDFSIRATKSSPDAIGKGFAIWGAASAYANRDGSLFVGDLDAGVTALEVTCTKDGTADATEAALLGGIAEVRASKVAAVVAGETAAIAVTRTEAVVG